MVEPVNLRQFRKRKLREAKETQADKNRQHHGISTKLKKVAKQQNKKEHSKLDGHSLLKKMDD